MLVADDLPELGTDLVTTLSGLRVSLEGTTGFRERGREAENRVRSYEFRRGRSLEQAPFVSPSVTRSSSETPSCRRYHDFDEATSRVAPVSVNFAWEGLCSIQRIPGGRQRVLGFLDVPGREQSPSYRWNSASAMFQAMKTMDSRFQLAESQVAREQRQTADTWPVILYLLLR